MTKQELFSAVLLLPPQQRLELADALWSSLDQGADPTCAVDETLSNLIQTRCDELDSGKVAPISHDEVMSRLNKALSRCSSATTPPSPKN